MTFSSNPGRRWRMASMALAVVGALAGCGGGTSQYDPFSPGRVLVFGDETSALTSTGQKYSINGFTAVDQGDGTTADVADCTRLPNWTQSLAASYGFVFAECNPNSVETIRAKNYAAEGAMVDDLKVQVDAQIANGGFRDDDLATVLAGANDVIDLYRQYPGRTEEDLTNELRARGKRLAEQVNRLVGLGARVILSTVPDMGVSPYALKQRAEFSGTDRAALLSRLTAAFNEQLGVNVVLDGRFVGIVQTDLRTQAMARSPASFGLINATNGACLDGTPPPDCTTATLVEGAGAGTYMWADDLRLSYAAQNQIAGLAIDRSRRNPF